MKLFKPDPPEPPPGAPPECQCFNQYGSKHGRHLPRLHRDVQNTTCDAWHHVLARVEEAAKTGDAKLEPLAGLTGEQRAQIVTLPAEIDRLSRVRELRLYGSHIVRVPPEIGAMSDLTYLDVYTSRCLHFFPYELTRCTSLRDSRVSTRALYGNQKHRPPFPDLNKPENAHALSQITPRTCSVCNSELAPERVVRRWITLAVGTDYLPLLVNACSMDCIAQLPTPAEGFVGEPHSGGHHVVQPEPAY